MALLMDLRIRKKDALFVVLFVRMYNGIVRVVLVYHLISVQILEVSRVVDVRSEIKVKGRVPFDKRRRNY